MNPTKLNWEIQTTAYAGPLELVLTLIEERKLLVNELALASITDEFVKHVRSQEAFPLEEAANFIQIAATLILIKSKSLIPDLALTHEEEVSIEDFERRLKAYEQLREAARELASVWDKRYLFASGERPAEATFAPSSDLTPDTLAAALARVLAAREAVEKLPEAKVKPMISIEEMMERLAKRVEQAMNLSFKEFSGGTKERIEVIVSFLALLELVKQGAVEAEQYEHHGDIRISHTSSNKTPHYG